MDGNYTRPDSSPLLTVHDEAYREKSREEICQILDQVSEIIWRSGKISESEKKNRI